MDKKENKEDNKQIIVFQDAEEEKNPNALTWAKYGHFINVFKYWIIGVTILCGVAGYLVIHFAVNPSKEKLTSSFTYQAPLVQRTSENGTSSYYYLDYTIFDKTNIVSSTNLKYVQDTILDSDGNKKYASVDIDGLLNENAISIEQNTKTVGTSASSTTEDIPLSFTITATAKYFGSETLGKAFINDLIDTVSTKSITALNNYQITNYLSDTFGTVDFEYDLTALSNQYAYDNSVLSSLSGTFGSQTIINSKTLNELAKSYLEKYYYTSTETIFDSLVNEQNKGFYVYYTDDTSRQEQLTYYSELGSVTYLKQMTEYNNTYKQLNTELTKYLNAVTNDVSIAKTVQDKMVVVNDERLSLAVKWEKLGYVVNYTDYTATLASDTDQEHWGKIQYLSHPDTKIKSTDTLTWAESCAAFKTKLSNCATSLKEDRVAINDIYRDVYKTYHNEVIFNTPGNVSFTGHVSGAIGALVGVLVGFLASSLIGAGYGNHKDNVAREEKEKAEASNATPKKVEEKPSTK